MLQFVALLSCSIIVALVVAFPLGRALRNHPGVFYALAIAVVAVYFAWRAYGFGGPQMRMVAPLVQKGYLASAFLAIVMFTGVLDEGSPLRRRLQPVRGELSVISSILFLGHLATYIAAFLPRLAMTVQFQPLLGAAIVVAIPLTCIFAALSVTSLRAVKSRMPAPAWRGLQKLSYVMVALVVAHVALAIGRSALDGSDVARASLAVYGIAAVLYAFLRVRKAVRDRA